jgi:putative NADPH-quinone reductase
LLEWLTRNMTSNLRRIVIIQGHPDSGNRHFCHAIAGAYMDGARDAGHQVEIIEVGRLAFPLLHGRQDFEGPPPEAIRLSQEALIWSNHVAMIYPIWNGAAPALLKGFLEQTFRPTFVFPGTKPNERLTFTSYFSRRKSLSGRSARVIATMQMPGFVYRWYFHPHPEKNTLAVAGLKPIRETFIGLVESPDGRKRNQWLTRVKALGRAGR